LDIFIAPLLGAFETLTTAPYGEAAFWSKFIKVWWGNPRASRIF